MNADTNHSGRGQNKEAASVYTVSYIGLNVPVVRERALLLCNAYPGRHVKTITVGDVTTFLVCKE